MGGHLLDEFRQWRGRAVGWKKFQRPAQRRCTQKIRADFSTDDFGKQRWHGVADLFVCGSVVA